jgi:hypothetical protein
MTKVMSIRPRWRPAALSGRSLQQLALLRGTELEAAVRLALEQLAREP